MRVFLGRLTYFLFLVVYLAGDAFRDSRAPIARVAPVLLLMVPAVYAWAFVRRLSPALRQYLQVRQHVRVFGGVSVRTQRFTTTVLWWIAGAFALLTAFLLLSAVGLAGTGKGALPASLIFFTGFLAMVWLIRRRRSAGRS